MSGPFGYARRALRWLDRMLRITSELNLGLLSAGVAFFGLLAFFPAMGALVTLWGAFADPAVIEQQIHAYDQVVPDAATRVIATRLHSLAQQPKPALGLASITSFLLALWVSRLAVAGLIRAMNAVYRTGARGPLRHNGLSIALTLLLMGVAMVAIATIFFVPLAGQVFLNMPPPGAGVELMRWCVAMAATGFGLSVVYRFGPNRASQRTPWLSFGAGFAMLSWGLASWGFASFLQLHNRYDVVYGSLGTSVAMLLWFYITAYVVVLGGLLNAEIEGVALDSA